MMYIITVTVLPYYDVDDQVNVSFSNPIGIDGFHSLFSLGNWRALHHHSVCWLANIHITWHFCPPVSMVKDAMESVYCRCSGDIHKKLSIVPRHSFPLSGQRNQLKLGSLISWTRTSPVRIQTGLSFTTHPLTLSNDLLDLEFVTSSQVDYLAHKSVASSSLWPPTAEVA